MPRRHVLRVTIKDCDVETFNVSGGGGQRRDKKDTGVRIRHQPSGAVGVGRESRKQIDNKRAAFRRMAESEEFQRWARVQAASPFIPSWWPPADADLTVEVKRNGAWEPA